MLRRHDEAGDIVNATNHADLIDKLTALEYAIRRSITVREDQDETADPQQLDEAARFGIRADDQITKGELLSAVQTMVRAAQAAQ